MTSILINNILGLTYPYNIYVCDVYGNSCIYIAEVTTSIPPTIEIVLPLQFNTAPAVGIKIIASNGCERFKIFDCVPPIEKQFQDYEFFDFMDDIRYTFQN